MQVRMKVKTFAFGLCLLLAGALRLGCQAVSLAVEPVIANAAPLQMGIQCVFLDHTGFLWVGCQNGLLRYDGYRVIPCSLDAAENRAGTDPSVRSICEGPDGKLWLATAQGLVRYDPANGASVRFRHDESRLDTLSADDITYLYLSPALPGRLWIATANGDLEQFDLANEKVTRSPVAGSPRAGRIHVISGDPAGFLWIGASSGLYRFQPPDGRLQFCSPAYPVTGSKKSFSVTAIFRSESSPDTLWVGSDGAGLFRYFPAAGLWQRAAEGEAAGILSSDIAIHAIESFPGEPQNILIGAENGMYHFDPRLGRSSRISMLYNMTDVQASQCTQVIYHDRRGTFWIGSCSNGLDKWVPRGKTFSRSKPYPNAVPSPLANWVTSMNELASGDILLTTYGGGALIFNRQAAVFRRLWLDPANPQRKLNSFITDSAVDGDGTLWFTTAEGFAHCSPSGRLQHLYRYAANGTDKTGLLVFTFCRDRSGYHWLATDQGLLRLDTDKDGLRRFRHDRQDQKSLSHDRVNAILADGDTLWVGTDNGVNRLLPGGDAFSVFKSDPADPASLSSNLVTYIAHDGQGRIWICTANGLNLLRQDGGRVFFQRYLVPGNDSRQNSFLSVIEEDSRHFWLGSKAGLARFDPERGTFTFYDRQDGVEADGMNEAFFFFRSRDHEIFFGGRYGFTGFRPASFALNLYPPPLAVTELRIEQDLDGAASMRRTGRKNVRVELAALDFVRPEKNQYAYLLEGRDRDWTYQGTNRVVLLSGLPIGRYTLRVKAANNDGIWNETGIEIKIRVRLPFHEQYGIALLMAGLLAALAAAVFWRRRRARRLRIAALPENLDLVLEKFAISKREAEIVRLLLAGKSNKEIEDQLFIAMATVKIHVHNIFQKVKVSNRLQLLLRIQQEAKKLK
jgi:ligand-binding sensor domain-containing protein/DNA-binding CsgD family transcriptional regulator